MPGLSRSISLVPRPWCLCTASSLTTSARHSQVVTLICRLFPKHPSLTSGQSLWVRPRLHGRIKRLTVSGLVEKFQTTLADDGAAQYNRTTRSGSHPKYDTTDERRVG